MNISDNSRICKVVYDLMLKMYVDGSYKHHWIDFIKTTLDNLGLSFIFSQQGNVNTGLNLFKSLINQRLKDHYIQQWNDEISTKVNCLCYRLFKTDFKFENYLITLPKNKWKPLIEFWTGNGYFRGNHFNIPSDNKASIKCPLCTHFNPDLFHYLLSCSYFNRLRRKFKVKSVVNTLSFRNVVNNEKTLFNVATFVKEILLSLKEIILISRSQHSACKVRIWELVFTYRYMWSLLTGSGYLGWVM